VKTWLDEQDCGQWLMIIDSADDGKMFFGPSAASQKIEVGSQQGFSRFIPQSSKGTILLTTRNKHVSYELTGGGEILHLSPMSPSDAESLFKGSLKGAPPEQADMAELPKLLEYLPLAVVQAAAFISRNTQKVSDYIELYTHSDSTSLKLLDEDFKDLGRDEEGPNAVFRTWNISFDQIRRENLQAAAFIIAYELR
jgi:hypothetical protein